MQQAILVDYPKEWSSLTTDNRIYINEEDSLNSFHSAYCPWGSDNITGSAIN